MTMKSKFDGRCKRCGGAMPAGTLIDWTRDAGAVHADVLLCATLASEQAPPTVTKDARPIAEFLAAAKARGLKYPKARFLAPCGGEMRLSVAGEKARVPGSIQVVVREQWIGRIEPSGDVYGALADNVQMLDALDKIAADPATAAREYGALMGRCSFCDMPITDDGSVEVGYGPVCAKRYGLPHAPKGTRRFTPEDRMKPQMKSSLSERAVLLLQLIDSCSKWDGDERPGRELTQYWVPQRMPQFVQGVFVDVHGSGDARIIRMLAGRGLIQLLKQKSMGPYCAHITEDGIAMLAAVESK